jgi:membrane associated rhomboid family serine protease
MIPIRDRLPRRRAPFVSWMLILANVLAFVWERGVLAQGYPERRFLLDFGLVPARLLAHVFTHPLDALSSVATSMFLHDPTSVLHLAGNMLFLWVFGDNVEDALGHARFLLFYLLSGVAAAAAQVFIDPTSMVPMVGASGAIAGVLAAYVTLYPRAPVTVVNPMPILWLFFGLTFTLPAWMVILEFFLFNLVNGFAALDRGLGAGGGVAFFAHLGGFVAGLALVRVLLQNQRPPSDDDVWTRRRPDLRFDSYGVPRRVLTVHRPWGG